MAAPTTGRIPKPEMRGLLVKNLRRHAVGSIVFTAGIAYLFKRYVCDERKKKYANFYIDYDENKVFEDMKQKGVFQNFPPDK